MIHAEHQLQLSGSLPFGTGHYERSKSQSLQVIYVINAYTWYKWLTGKKEKTKAPETQLQIPC